MRVPYPPDSSGDDLYQPSYSPSTLAGSRLNSDRLVVLHGPPGAGKSTVVAEIKKSAPAGAFAYDAETGGPTYEDRLSALEHELTKHADDKLVYAVIGAADLSKFLVDTLPLARHVFISPGVEELALRHESRGESDPAKLKQDSDGIYKSMLADPLFSSMVMTDDARAWVEAYIASLKPVTTPAPQPGDVVASEYKKIGHKGREIPIDDNRADLLSEADL